MEPIGIADHRPRWINIFLSLLLGLIIPWSSGACAEDTDQPQTINADQTMNTDEQLLKDFDVKPQDLKAAVYNSESEYPMPYRYFVPNDYTADGKYPLILFLHGAGECGTDNISQLKHPQPLQFVQAKCQAKYPCFFVAPQSAPGRTWAGGNLDCVSESLSLAIQIVDDLLKKYPGIDRDRIYVTGLSSGGIGAWEAMLKNPHKFAAIIPICAGWFPEMVRDDNLAPVWAFVGDKDANALTSLQLITKSVRQHGGQAKLTICPGQDHTVWEIAYLNPELPNWLFAQSLAF